MLVDDDEEKKASSLALSVVAGGIDDRCCRTNEMKVAERSRSRRGIPTHEAK